MVSVVESSPVHRGVAMMEYGIFHSIPNHQPSAFCVNLILLIIKFIMTIKPDALELFSKFDRHFVNLFLVITLPLFEILIQQAWHNTSHRSEK